MYARNHILLLLIFVAAAVCLWTRIRLNHSMGSWRRAVAEQLDERAMLGKEELGFLSPELACEESPSAEECTAFTKLRVLHMGSLTVLLTALGLIILHWIRSRALQNGGSA